MRTIAAFGQCCRQGSVSAVRLLRSEGNTLSGDRSELVRLNCGGELADFLHSLVKANPGVLKTLKQGKPEFDPTLFAHWLGRELTNEFFASLTKVRLELVPKHADDTSLVNALWDELVCEVATNPEKYLEEPEKVGCLVDEFGERWKKPLSEFEVVFAIDWLAIGQEPINLLGVEFFAPSDEALETRAIPKSEIAKWSKKTDTITLAAVRVEASSSSTAAVTGREKVADGLTLMRAATLRGRSGKAVADELLQWQMSGHSLVRRIEEGESSMWLWGFHRPFSPLVVDLGNDIRNGIAGLGLDQYGCLPGDIGDRVSRAIYWISHSTIHETDDHKVVDLCTALETLLLPEGKGISKKGAVIALRYKLFGGGLNPPAVKRMYDLRNEVVHGGPLPVVGELDTWHIRLVCLETVGLIVRASVDRPSVETLEHLVGTVETIESISSFLEEASMGIFKGRSLPEIVGVAQNTLRQKGVGTK